MADLDSPLPDGAAGILQGAVCSTLFSVGRAACADLILADPTARQPPFFEVHRCPTSALQRLDVSA